MPEATDDQPKSSGVDAELPTGAHRDVEVEDDEADSAPASSTDKDELALTKRDASSSDDKIDSASADSKRLRSTVAPDDKLLADRGWHMDRDEIERPLVEPLDNELLWMLQRRFAKQIQHVKQCDRPPSGLDLQVSNEEEFSPDKLRAHIERVYMSTFLSLAAFVKHAARIASWNERVRSALFATAYALAWAFDVVMPTLLALVFVLVVIPQSRAFLFPPKPLALVDALTGNMKEPRAGELGSTDTITGAAEAHKGEAAEAEAANLTASVAQIAISAAMGSRKPRGEDTPAAASDAKEPSATEAATNAVKATIWGGQTSTDVKTADKTKQPMSDMIWTTARPFMRALADLADGSERLHNALSPTPPFGIGPRLRLGVMIGAASLGSYFVTAHTVVRGAEAAFGVLFFGQPLLIRNAKALQRMVPDWPKYLELRRTIMRGVPTDAQLTITLLRLGEANQAPLPPPPSEKQYDAPPPSRTRQIADSVSEKLAGESDESGEDKLQANDSNAVAKRSPTPAYANVSLFGLAKGTSRAVAATVLGSNRVKASARATTFKRRLGFAGPPSSDGPSEFAARFKGKKGYVAIVTSTEPPCLTFLQPSKVPGDDGAEPVWSVGLADIIELKKVGGLGWKLELLVGWALDQEVADGLEVHDKSGNVYELTAITRRDELFGRLVAIGGSAWESM